MSLNAALLADTLQRAKQENGGLTNLGMSFYRRLFEKYPSVKPLFTTPPEEQHKKLMASIGAIVASTKNPVTMLPYLRAMAIRHLKYRVVSEQYPAVAENLVAVLGAHLSAEGEWTPEMQQAWEEALETVCSVMVEAAENPEKYSDELTQAGYRSDGFRDNDPEPWVLAGTAAE